MAVHKATTACVAAFLAVGAMLFATPGARADAVSDLVAGLKASGEARIAAQKAAGPAGARAVSPLAELMESADPDVVKAAAAALHNVAHYAARPEASAEERAAVAAELAKVVGPERGEKVRREALYLVGLTGGDPEVPLVAGQVKDAAVAEEAIAALERLPGDAPTDALVDALTFTSDATQLRVIAALGARGAKAAQAPLIQLGRESGGEIAWAVVDALSEMGVPPNRVFRLPAGGPAVMTRRYVAAMLRAADVGVEQGDTNMAEALYASVATFYVLPEQGIAALHGLKDVKSEKLINHALGYMGDQALHHAAVSTLKEAEIEDLNERLVQAYQVVSPYQRARILEILSVRGAPEVQELVQEGLNDPDAQVRIAAATLSDAAPDAEDLLLVGTRGVLWTREPALRQYLALARSEKEDGNADAARAMFETLAAADAPAGIRAEAIDELAQTADSNALPLLEALMQDPEAAEAATRVYVQVLAAGEQTEEAKNLLLDVAVSSPYPEAATLASEKLAEMGVDSGALASAMGFIRNWTVLKPEIADAAAAELEITPSSIQLDFGAEALVEVTATGNPPIVDLKSQFEKNEDVFTYAFAEVEAAHAMPVLLKVGSDDGCVVWVNGKRVHEALQPRSLQVDQDIIETELAQGANRIMIKVQQGGADWQFVARLTDRDGRPLNTAQQPLGAL